MIEGPVVEQFYYILETFLILWLYQQSIKYFAIYEEKSNCAVPVIPFRIEIINL
jgi:hypothetical protein